MGDLVAQTIERMRAQATPIRAVMLDRLGPNVWHSTPAAAMAALEELEETARLWLLAGAKAGAAHTRADRSTAPAIWRFVVGSSTLCCASPRTSASCMGNMPSPTALLPPPKMALRRLSICSPMSIRRSSWRHGCKTHGLVQVLFNAPPGNWAAGERGLASLPGREAEFRAAIQTALEYAQTLSCPRVHVMAGVQPSGVERAAMRRTFVANLAWAAELAAPAGVELLIEPINTTGYARLFSKPPG